MAKFKVNYTEVYTRSFIVEAENKEEAQEKMERAAESVPGLITNEDFDHWDVGMVREATQNDISRCDMLPEG